MYPTTFGKFMDPRVTCSHFHLRDGDVVADFGAGTGHFMQPLSELVGRSGKVYLFEIQKNLVEAMGNRAREQRLTNAHPVWADFEAPNGTKLTDGVLDAGLLSNTFFQTSDKDSALREVARVLRKGAKLFIIDWTDSFGGLGPQPDHVVTEESARRFLQHAGFVVEHTFPAGDHHYGLSCRKV